ncbi:MBL fold metallo-hydrolase [Pseudomonas cremoricolorata]|uniref:Beta-lactamase n=1 Tax=Pseudomonas cremoricolorata TaxID=157783 RepID=A0A089WH63_9PSED|nr:MBL fold metallo-hydrolase [Pseudomonas cremoricolorata]AIR87941.1 beta-lactamase [Pseudomonas cremoricolorata]
MPLRAVLGRLLLACCLVSTPLLAAEPLQLEVYNPGKDALFPVSSVIISGKRDALLIDAQFGKTQARQLVRRLKASGKRLKAIYISHGDPDYYFGLYTVLRAFPRTPVLASPATAKYIRKTMNAKRLFWGPKLGADAPERLIAPKVLKGDRLILEGQAIQVVGLDGPQAERSFVWIPSIAAVAGGVVVSQGLHVWMADTQSAQSHVDWLSTLERIESLQPRTVIPGHYLGESTRDVRAVQFTAQYIRDFDDEASKARDAVELIAAMKLRYPRLADDSALELSAKVAKGEMSWP